MGVVDYDWTSWSLILLMILFLLILLITFWGKVVDKSWSVPNYLMVVPPDRDAPMMKAVPGIFEMSL
jgi:hypothetical protein